MSAEFTQDVSQFWAIMYQWCTLSLWHIVLTETLCTIADSYIIHYGKKTHTDRQTHTHFITLHQESTITVIHFSFDLKRILLMSLFLLRCTELFMDCLKPCIRYSYVTFEEITGSYIHWRGLKEYNLVGHETSKFISKCHVVINIKFRKFLSVCRNLYSSYHFFVDCLFWDHCPIIRFIPSLFYIAVLYYKLFT